MSTSTTYAVAGAAAAAWLVTAHPAGERLERLHHEVGRRARARDRAPTGAVIAAGIAAVLTRSPLLVVGAALAGAVADDAWRRLTGRRAADAARRAMPGVLRLIAAELQAGAAPHAALEASARAAPQQLASHLSVAAAGARLGLDVADALLPPPVGAESLRAVAACWRVTTSAGAGLGSAMTRLADGLAADERCRAEVEAQLAGPRASAAVLAGLPAVAVAMAAGLGADPAAFFSTPTGAACLVVGVALDAAGLTWTRRLAARALR